jgi:hypothetical protein
LKLLLSNFLYASSPDVASKFKAVCIAPIVVAPNIETCCGAVKYQLVAHRFNQTKYLSRIWSVIYVTNKLLILVPAGSSLLNSIKALNKLPVASLARPVCLLIENLQLH